MPRFEKRKADAMHVAVDVCDELYHDRLSPDVNISREQGWKYFISERQRKIRLTGASLENAKKAFNAIWNFMMGPPDPAKKG